MSSGWLRSEGWEKAASKVICGFQGLASRPDTSRRGWGWARLQMPRCPPSGPAWSPRCPQSHEADALLGASPGRIGVNISRHQSDTNANPLPCLWKTSLQSFLRSKSQGESCKGQHPRVPAAGAVVCSVTHPVLPRRLRTHWDQKRDKKELLPELSYPKAPLRHPRSLWVWCTTSSSRASVSPRDRVPPTSSATTAQSAHYASSRFLNKKHAI